MHALTPPPTPDPTYETDTPLTRLQTPELFLLSSLRLWMAAFVDPAGQHPDWREGMTAAGVEHRGVPAFEGFWRILAAEPLRALDLRCPTCPGLGEDEGRFLQAVQLLQARCYDEALATLADWLPPAALRKAILPLRALARCLGEAGLTLPDRRSRPALPRGSLVGTCADRGLHLLH